MSKSQVFRASFIMNHRMVEPLTKEFKAFQFHKETASLRLWTRVCVMILARAILGNNGCLATFVYSSHRDMTTSSALS